MYKPTDSNGVVLGEGWRPVTYGIQVNGVWYEVPCLIWW